MPARACCVAGLRQRRNSLYHQKFAQILAAQGHAIHRSVLNRSFCALHLFGLKFHGSGTFFSTCWSILDAVSLQYRSHLTLAAITIQKFETFPYTYLVSLLDTQSKGNLVFKKKKTGSIIYTRGAKEVKEKLFLSYQSPQRKAQTSLNSKRAAHFLNSSLVSINNMFKVYWIVIQISKHIWLQ